MTIIISFIVLLSILISVFISTRNYKTGLLVIGGIFFLSVLIFSVYNFVFGFYATMTFGFLAWTINRAFDSADLPIALIVEIPAYVSFLGLIIHKWGTKDLLFNDSKNIVSYSLFGYFIFLCLEIFNPEMNSFEGWSVFIRRFLLILVSFFIALHVFETTRRIVNFFKFWIILSLISGIYACKQQWFGLFDFELNLIQFDRHKLRLLLIDGVLRKSSLFSDPATFGITMAATFSLILVLFLTDVKKKYKLKYFFVNIVILLGVAYSGTRTAYFIIISGICLYILTTINQFRTVVFSIFTLFAFLLLMYLPIYSNTTINRIRSTFEFSDDASMNVRDVNRSSIQPYIHSHPFGGGLNTSGGPGTKYNPGHILSGFPPDSGYVKVSIETGWVGLFLLCIIYFITLQYGFRTYFKCKNKILKQYVFASIVCIFTFVIAQYGQEATDQIPGFFLFYSCFAVIVKARYIDEKLNPIIL
jgi:hypothetical protein